MRNTPLSALLQSQGVILPDRPLDLSARLRKRGITRCYGIVMTGRTGSTWLATALEQIEGCGSPHEYFAEDTLLHYLPPTRGMSFEDLIVELVARYARNGVFGFKSNPNRIGWLAEHLDFSATFSSISTAWIDMRRWNLVRQAYSFLRAKKSGTWHRFTDGRYLPTTAPMAQVALDDAAVWAEIRAILRQEVQAEGFYSDWAITPLRSWYEELHESKRSLLLRVGRHIGRPLTLADMTDISDRTEKLATLEDVTKEDSFVERHAEALNRISELRVSCGCSNELDSLLRSHTAALAATGAI